tara:strand:+ start:162 stop:431 length:270 start_codon:yes stop_codon:yes gene_type:complete
MPIYKAKIKCFVGDSLREAGEEFEYNGKHCSHIELVGGPIIEEKPAIKSIDYDSMTKAELEVYGRSIGIELDRRQTRDTLIAQLEAVNK